MRASIFRSQRRHGVIQRRVSHALESIEPRVLLAATPQLLADTNTAPGGSSPAAFVEMGGVLYFVANDGVHGSELWRTDGTPAGTSIVRDVNPGPNTGVSPSEAPVVFGGALYFAATDPSHGSELWRSDGTAAGTTMVVD